MSISYGVACVTCGIEAPTIGDGGLLGTPSLSLTIGKYRYRGWEKTPSFWYFYEPLVAFGLRPPDLEAMHAFLQEHDGHALYLHDDVDDPSSRPPELAALWRKHEKKTKPSRSRRGVMVVAGRPAGEYVLGRYGVHCLDCRSRKLAPQHEMLKSFDRLPLARKPVDLLLKRWASRDPGDGWNFGLGSLVDPFGSFMPELLVYVQKHRTHRLEARLAIVSETLSGAACR